MLRLLVRIALLVTAPLTATPILIDGYGNAGSGYGHVDLFGQGVSISAALASGHEFGQASCRAGDFCNLTFEGNGAADNPVGDITEIGGTYLGQSITPETYAHFEVSFHGSLPVQGLPYPSNYEYLSVPVSVAWTGLIRIWPGGPGTAGIELAFSASGPAQVSLEAYPNQLVCPTPPGGWTEQPPQSCFATNFLVRGLGGPLTGTLEQVPEPSTWTALGAGLIALIGAAARRRRLTHSTVTLRVSG